MLSLGKQDQAKRCGVCSIVILLFFASFTPFLCAQQAGYPAPRNPDYKKAVNATVEDLLPIARMLVRKPRAAKPLEPGYGIKPGDRVLIVVSTQFDQRVIGAIERAIVEAGGKVDILRTDSPPPAEIVGNIGIEEARVLTGSAVQVTSLFNSTDIRMIVQALSAEKGRPVYNLVLNGSGGPIPRADYPWEYIPWDTIDKFVFGMASFPTEVQDMLDQLLWDTLAQESTIHATDPEGTDMTWHWQPNFRSLLREHWPSHPEMSTAGHISAMPLFMSPASADANGVIGGTINHTGSFPHIKLTLAKNEIVKVEGGGEYGERWQKILQGCRGVQFPGFPAPGCGWFEEAAIGTDPWRARELAADMRRSGTSWERGRAGVIHWGLGVSQNLEYHPGTQKWYQENTGPKTMVSGDHRHIHTMFTTMDVTDLKGKTTRVLNKGHVTFLDDPEVRKIAAKYGNPDEMLTEKWIPAIPGINVPGDYMKDYGQDPYAYNHPMMEKLRQEAGWKPRN